MRSLVSRSRVIAPAVLALVFVSPCSLRAALIAYEGFNHGLADNAAIGTDSGWQQAAANPAGTAWQYKPTLVDVVPEPSAAVFGLLGAMGLVRRHR